MKQLRGKALKKLWKQFERPARELCFVLNDVEDPVNVGAAFRIGDGCGVNEIILTGVSPLPTDELLGAVSRGLHRRIPWRYEKLASDALTQVREQGYLTCALEATTEAVPYHEFVYPDKVCLVVGNEYHGVTRQALEHCDAAIYIPMYGKIKSLNVHVALGVAAFHVLHCSQPEEQPEE
ncbi:MAG: TrmH family RNA methyltransferase [Caldilineaceae bacterium]